jgi:1-acyl-sn-glycerol-3-phosphate acyltransferase
MLQKTIFDSGWINNLLRKFSLFFFRVNDWEILGAVPRSVQKCVIVAAPHTTWLDLPYSLMLASCLKMKIYWMGKEELFAKPFGGIMRWLGGISIKRNERSRKTDFYASVLRESSRPLHLVIAPAGTRKNMPAREWKRGYYDISVKAGVPIVLGYINYKERIAGIGKIFIPTGNYDDDIKFIEDFYRGHIPSRG